MQGQAHDTIVNTIVGMAASIAAAGVVGGNPVRWWSVVEAAGVRETWKKLH